MRKPDIEGLKALLHDGRVHIASGKILQLEVAPDKSIWYAKCLVFPDEYEVIAQMTWSQVGPNSGIYGPAMADDLVLLALDQEMDQVYVIARLSSDIDLIPQQAIDGDTIVKATTGKNLHIASDTSVFLGKGVDGSNPDEPIVLGSVLKQLLSDILSELDDLTTKLAAHTHIGNLGGTTTPPDVTADITTVKTNLAALKSSPVDDDAINSDIVFCEKGA